jgi:DNA polymerase elongation subunit (family B)
MAAEMRAGEIDINAYVITKGITKNLDEYNEKGQAHVIVAKRMRDNVR